MSTSRVGDFPEAERAGGTIKLWWWLLVGSYLVGQAALAVILWKIVAGREFSHDTADYLKYLADPWMLLKPVSDHDTVGGRIASPLLPVVISPLIYAQRILGINTFLALRGTMIICATIGMGIGWGLALRDYGVPRGWRQSSLMWLLWALPVCWLATSLMSQDDAIAAAWSGLALWAWRRHGPIASLHVAGLGMFCAKPFLVLIFLPLWLATPGKRWTLFLYGTIWVASWVALIAWRDSGLASFGHSVHPTMSGNLCSIWWILAGYSTPQAAHDFRILAKQLGSYLTLIVLGGWTVAGLSRPVPVPRGVVITYCLFFVAFVGMMPEYELWYMPWLIYVLWEVARRGDYATCLVGWSHSAWGYAYKLLYACDHRIFNKALPSPLQTWYARTVDWDLRLPLVICAAATILSALWLAWRLWRTPPAAGALSMK
ncbi:MAG: hypothetical protein SFX18_10295 [Pirellulales bacterium]|nr:hypothetical protein [Pirellulales bacterium]